MTLDFDPLVDIAGLSVRWEAIALAVVLVLASGLWVVELRDRLDGAVSGEDIAFVLLAVIPGAVVGGRLVHVLDFQEVYRADPRAALDFGRGSLSLLGAVIGGCLTGGYMCRLLGGRVGVWADAAALPLLVVIGGGKLAQLLGGAGQGVASDGPLALAFGGVGPWRTPDPLIAAWPSQVLEGGWALLGVVPVLLVGERWRRGPRDGHGLLLLLAVAWWLLGRVLVSTTWRDEPTILGVGAEGVLSAIALLVTLVWLAIGWWRAGQRGVRQPEPHGSPT